MAISLSGATIDSSERTQLLSSSVDTSTTGNTEGSLYEAYTSNGSLVGVTEDFSNSFVQVMDTYKANVQGVLDQLQNISSSNAFRGEEIQAAISRFIDSVKSLANNYLARLTSAEKQIVASVHSAYATQDTDISTDIRSDTSAIDALNTSGTNASF